MRGMCIFPSQPAFFPQLASRAAAAAVAPIMAMRAIPKVAGVGVFFDEVHQCLAAELLRQLPRLRFVDPHERRFNRKAFVHAERQRQLHGFHRVVAAIGVAGEIGFAHACHEHVCASAVSQRGSKREKQQIAAGHESVGQATGFHVERDIARQRGFAHLAQDVDIEQMILPQLACPLRKLSLDLAQHHKPCIQLHPMTLPVVKTNRFNAWKMLQSPRKASGGILPAREQDEGGLASGRCDHAHARIIRDGAPCGLKASWIASNLCARSSRRLQDHLRELVRRGEHAVVIGVDFFVRPTWLALHACFDGI
jgi:hypothetical protein